VNAERWAEVCRVFDAARELPRDERAAFLERECRGDGELASEVASLLVADEGTSFLDEPGGSDLAPRRRVGPYELRGELGRGGMGVVYEAVRRDQGFERAVALKVVKRGMDTDDILRRFETERRILADLDHPNIARVLDGGSTEDGLPYFVMELIRGEHLLEYCEKRELDTAARLGLFRQVCSAVTYAHQRLVIHRDIKPANILVTAEGVPKLLDFGIAKLLSGAPGAAADRTETAMRVLTPEYASPEQVLGTELTTSSDVYSLGVLLYELLTGRRPYRLAARTPGELAAAVVQQQPERPGTAVRLHRDLDHIAMMALRKEPARRYASAEQLSEDVRRHLEGLPVQARPDSLGYRAGKFVRRHQVAVAALTLAVASLVAGFALAVRGMRVAQAERRRAEEHLAQVRTLATSFLFEHHDAIKDLAGSTPARKLLIERGVTYLDRLSTEAGSDPAFRRELAAAYEKLGNFQVGIGNEGTLGSSEDAAKSFRKALRLRVDLAGRTPLDPKDQGALAQTLISMGNLAQRRGDKAGSLALYRRSVAIGEAVLPSRPSDADLLTDLGRAYHFLAAGLVETWDESARLAALRREAELFGRVVALKPADRKARRNLALADQYLGSALSGWDDALPGPDLAAAARFLEEARSLQEALSTEDPGNATYKKDLSSTYSELGYLFKKTGRREDEVEAYRSSLRIRLALEAADPKDIVVQRLLNAAQSRLASALRRAGSQAEAVENARESVARAEGVAAADPKNVYFKAELGQALYELGASLGPSSLRDSCASLRRSHDLYALLARDGQLPASHRRLRESAAEAMKTCGSAAAIASTR